MREGNEKTSEKKGKSVMKLEKSCGAVVYREKDNGKRKILLIRHKNGGHWAFPKGHVEKGESEEETALREIREETALRVKLDTGFRRVVTFSPKPNVQKDVVYFAAKADSKHVKAQEEEVIGILWANPEEALETVTYENDRETLRAFLEYLAGKE